MQAIHHSDLDAPVVYKKQNSFINKDTWRRFRQNKASLFGLILFSVFVFCLLFADLITPYQNALTQDLTVRLQGISKEYFFGTDAFGRDIFARVVHGTRYSLLMGIVSVAIGMVLGSIIASIAALYGGKVDAVIMWIMDTILCIPMILLALAIVAVLGSGLQQLLMALVIAAIPSYVRVVRSSILTIVNSDFVEAARSCGTPDKYIVLKHVLPNAIGTVIVQATMSIGAQIIWAASLSYIGMGIKPPSPEWGAMLSEGKEYMLKAPHMVIFPGLAIILCCLSLNLIGDGLRDALDPKLKD